MNSKVMLTVGAAALIVLALLYGMRSSTSDSNVKPGAANVASGSASGALNTSPIAKNSQTDNTPSPWANSGKGSVSAGGEKPMDASNTTDIESEKIRDGTRGNLVGQGKKLTAAELQKFQDELLATVQSGNPDSKRLKEILTRLKQTQGSTVGGVNVDVLLNNLEKSQQIQDVAAQLQKESQKPGGPDQKKMQDYMDSLKKLQAQMRTDVMVANPAMQIQAK